MNAFSILSIAASSILLAAPASALTAPEVSCKAIFRTLDENNDTIEKVQSLAVTHVIGDIVKQEVELEGKYFSLTEEKGELFAQITTAPEYVKGSVVRGAADRQGRFTVTEVNGYTVHRLECRSLR